MYVQCPSSKSLRLISFSNPYSFVTKCRRPCIFKTRSTNSGLICERFTPSGCKDLVIRLRAFEFPFHFLNFNESEDLDLKNFFRS